MSSTSEIFHPVFNECQCLNHRCHWRGARSSRGNDHRNNNNIIHQHSWDWQAPTNSSTMIKSGASKFPAPMDTHRQEVLHWFAGCKNIYQNYYICKAHMRIMWLRDRRTFLTKFISCLTNATMRPDFWYCRKWTDRQTDRRTDGQTLS